MRIPRLLGRPPSGGNAPHDEDKARSDLDALAEIESGNAPKLPDPKFRTLQEYLKQVPAVDVVSQGDFSNGGWWVKLSIDIDHPLVWHVVQEFSYVLNGLSLTECLPTVFKPMSPPPYMNGGPLEYLSWVIECPVADTLPETVMKWLEGRLPRPVADENEWPDPKE